MLLALLTAGLVGALAISLVKRYADQQELDYLTANANAAARQALPLMLPQVSPTQLQQLAQTTAFLGNLRVRIQDTQKNIIADSGARNGPDSFVWIGIFFFFQGKSIFWPLDKALRAAKQPPPNSGWMTFGLLVS